MSAHENLSGGGQTGPKQSSNRTFGLVFTVFFLIVAVLPSLRGLLGLGEGGEVRLWALGVSGVFLLAALLVPVILTPLNKLWTALGILLHRVTNPIILGILFYGVFAPFGWLLRRSGKDFLHLDFEPEQNSYWIERDPPGPAADSVSNQF